MCGLCGSFTQAGVNLGKRDRTLRARTLEGLLLANQVRGTDSTGVAAINFDGAYDILKSAQAAARFVNREGVERLLRSDAPVMIGHTRMTSMGNDVRDENAHPFLEGEVIGAHNGIINNYMELDKTVRVDSQAVFRELDKNPDDISAVMGRVSGSATLTWWDRRDPNALYLVAHNNPLSVAIVPRIKTVYWSSVLDHLQTAMRIAYGKGVEYMEVKSDTVYRVDSEDVYQWSEQKVSFAPYGRGGANYRGWNEEDWDEYTGYTGMPMPKKGATAPKSPAPTALSLPLKDTPEEEARYALAWDKMLSSDRSQNENDEDYESKPNVPRGTHDIPNSDRFEVDALDGLDCGYCDKPIGPHGVWDAGLELMLCRACQHWWDDYGHYMTKDKAPSYMGPQA